jgi:thiamine biosynthesis lipoprotein ApbE
MIKSKNVRWGGDVSRMGEKLNAYRVFVRNPERKSQ